MSRQHLGTRGVISTERLYYTNAYQVAFDARVTARENDGRRVYLDRTAFYPTSGGQPHDVGSLGTARVLDVVDEDDRIAHILDAPVLAETVSGAVDWSRRFDHMQQHTGQHLVSAVFADELGYETVSVHFGADYATLDLATSLVLPDEMCRAERRANELVAANRAVTVEFEVASSASGLRKPSDRDGTLRVVTIAGLDRSACGGTHVRATGEIGAILLRGQEKMKQQSRIEFVCGLRAVQRARADFEALANVARVMNSSLTDVTPLVAGQVEQLRALTASRRALEEELAGYRARERHGAAEANGRGVRWVVERRATGATEELRPFALAYASLPKAAFAVICDEPRAVLLAASPDSGIDAGGWLKAQMIALGGRGGGSPRLAQGALPSTDALDQLARDLEALRANA